MVDIEFGPMTHLLLANCWLLLHTKIRQLTNQFIIGSNYSHIMSQPAFKSVLHFKKLIQENQKTIKRIKQVSSKLTYKGLEKVNQVAKFQVEIKHTNEFTLHLGNDYYAEVRAEEAIKILQLRIKFYEGQIAKLEAKTSKTQQPLLKGKQKVVKINDEKSGYLELVGTQNGEDIFNIIEVEGEEQNKFQQKSSVQPPIVKQIAENQQIQEHEIVEQKSPLITSAENQMIPEENDKSFSSEEQFRQDYQNQEDLQQYNESNNDLLQEVTRKMKLQAQKIIQNQMNNTTNLPIIKEETENQITQTNQKQTQPKIEEHRQTEKEIQIPAKISRFKLERMKQKLQQQL